MVERAAAEVLAEKMNAVSDDLQISADPKLYQKIAARLAEDPAITVRTDMVVERFIVEFHYDRRLASTSLHDARQVHEALTTDIRFRDNTEGPPHRIIVRPCPEATDA